jgi:regulator of protease activity HflC (stomatin/prohibitin superfamily)
MFEMLESKRVSTPGIALHIAVIVLGALVAGGIRNPIPLIGAALIGLYLLFSIKVVRQWEKVAVLRFGKFKHLQGPGVF